MSWRSIRLILLAALVAASLAAVPDALGYRFTQWAQQLGPEETVYDWGSQRCDDHTIFDAPPRAFHDSSGQVQLVLSQMQNRRMTGPSLGSLSLDCGVTMSSGANADPAAYDDKEWIAAPYTTDGTRVYAIVHDEYHGWEHPGMCAAPDLWTGCWYNALTLATSTNGGASYSHATPPNHLLAAPPYQYVADTGPYGFFEPSNIIRKRDGYYYSMFHVESYGAQQTGVCLMRTRYLSRPGSWRAWDGSGFNVSFVNPYVESEPPERHVCQPVAYMQLEKMSGSLAYSTYFRQYVLVGMTSLFDPALGRNVPGVYYSTSKDLIRWRRRHLIMEAELPWTYECGDENPVLHATLLDESRYSRNFELVGPRPYLYFVRFNYNNCIQSLDRDLIRIPIEFLSFPN